MTLVLASLGHLPDAKAMLFECCIGSIPTIKETKKLKLVTWSGNLLKWIEVPNDVRCLYQNLLKDELTFPLVFRANKLVVDGDEFETRDELVVTWISCIKAANAFVTTCPSMIHWIKMDPDTIMHKAVLQNCLEVLKWVYQNQNGCLWNRWICADAAHNGYFEVLKWVRAKGCPWDYNTCSYATIGGHLEVLRWCRQNGCPWDRKACLILAHAKNHTHVIKWIESQQV